jgi:hypothetical protein
MNTRSAGIDAEVRRTQSFASTGVGESDERGMQQESKDDGLVEVAPSFQSPGDSGSVESSPLDAEAAFVPVPRARDEVSLPSKARSVAVVASRQELRVGAFEAPENAGAAPNVVAVTSTANPYEETTAPREPALRPEALRIRP